MDDDYNPLIIDFGLSEEFIDSQNNIKTFKGETGTSQYICPQMFKVVKYSGIGADIFSLGVLLSALVSKSYGFKNSSGKDIKYDYIRNKKYSEYWNIFYKDKLLSKEFKDLYVKLVAYDPSERPTINEILTDNWLKEINDMNNTQMENYMKEYKKYMNEHLSKNNEDKTTIEQPETEDIREKEGFDMGPNKGISTDKTYFDDDLEPKKLNKKEFNMKYFLKIKAYIDPVEFMNSLANLIQKDYGEICQIETSDKKLKLKLTFENEENESNCKMNLVLFRADINEYYVQFVRKNSNIEDFYEYFLKIKEIIRKIIC